jgi:hypothetical protein
VRINARDHPPIIDTRLAPWTLRQKLLEPCELIIADPQPLPA